MSQTPTPSPSSPLSLCRTPPPLHHTCQVGVATEQVKEFKLAWMSHSYKLTKEYTSIYASQLVDFLKELPPPLGVGTEGSYYDCQILAKKVRVVHNRSPAHTATR